MKSEKLKKTGIYYVVVVVLMLFFAIYTAMEFPYTYITKEGDCFWVSTWDFWLLKLRLTPALTNWMSDYLMQFYRQPFFGASTHALLLGGIALLAHAVIQRVIGNKWHLAWLGLLPAVLLGIYCTFSLNFMMQCLFFFAALYGFTMIPSFMGKLMMGLLTVPVGFYLLRTPMLLTLLILQAALVLRYQDVKKCSYWLLPLVMLYFAPIIYSQQQAFIPFEKRYSGWGSYFDPLTSQYTKNGETIKKIVCLANEGRWIDLLYREHLRRQAQQGNITLMRYALLAESALGSLPENLLDYPIRDESQFYFPHERTYITLQFNRLFYLNLGIYDEAFHQAQEYSLLMVNGDCFSSLRQMVDYSIAEEEWEIADKYLRILAKSSCHKKFIKERRAMMQEAKQKPSRNIPLRADNFVGGYPLPVEMLRLARYYKDSPQRMKMIDYAICSYILRGDANSFLIALDAFDAYTGKKLPRAYQTYKDMITGEKN